MFHQPGFPERIPLQSVTPLESDSSQYLPRDGETHNICREPTLNAKGHI